MNARGLALRASLLLATTAHCATPDDEGGDPDDPPVEDAPLDMQVDAVDVVHGALRLRATMADGGPDVSVSLGGTCEPREVGAGLSTATAFTWTLGEKDVVGAIDCGLLVRATVRVGRHTAHRVAALGVSVSLTPPATQVEGSTEEPTEQEAEEDNSGQEAAPPPAPEPAEAPADPSATDPDTANVIPTTDLVRALLLHRQIVVHGDALDVAVEVGGVPLS
jgi:hypothetical protein